MKKLRNEELGRLSVDGFKKSVKSQVIVVLDNVRSLNNIGSVFRTSDAFRVEEIILCGITGTPPHREIHKTALGSTDSVKWTYFKTTPEAIQSLKKKNWTVIAIEQIDTSISLANFKPEKEAKYAFVFGNEINGITNEILDYVDVCIEIPQFGTKHSFNISISAGIVLWHYYFQISA